MDDYDRQYEFHLQLFVRSFCTSVVDDASAHMPDGPTTDRLDTTAPPLHQHKDVTFIDAALADEQLSSGAPTPASVTSPISCRGGKMAAAPRPTQRQDVHRHPLDIARVHLQELGEALLDGHAASSTSELANRYQHDTVHEWIDYHRERGPPKFADAFTARAYLQEVHILGCREEQFRQRWRADVGEWWSGLHRAVAPLHQRARGEATERQNVAYSEWTFRREVEDEHSLGLAVIRYLSLSMLYGPDVSQQWFEACADVSNEECIMRRRVVRAELSTRAQITAAMRLLRSHPPDRAWELVVVAQQVHMGEQHMSETTAGEASWDAGAASRDYSNTASRYRVPAPSRGTSVRTFPEVTPAMKAQARKMNMMEERTKRSESIRAFSSALHERLAKTRAEALAGRSIAVSAVKERNLRHREELRRCREADVLLMREQCRMEKLVVERQAFESKHPEFADQYRSFLIHPLGGSERQGWHGEEKAALRRPSSAAATVRPASAHSKTNAELANEMLKDVPCLPKHKLTRAQKEVLDMSSRLRRPASGSNAMRRTAVRTSLPPRPFSAALHNVSSIASDDDGHVQHALEGSTSMTFGRPFGTIADFGAPPPSHGSKQRSTTPPLDAPEQALLAQCEDLFRSMKRRSYHYAPPAPVLYTVDGLDAMQGRNLMGDDVEVHLLTPLERIVRWNLRAQLAFRNEQYAVAEVHLKNALTALHNAEKDRRRASRRRGRRSSHAGEGSDSFSHEESNGGFEGPTEGVSVAPSASTAFSPASNAHAVPSTPDSWTAGYGNLSLQNVKVLTYSTKAFLSRALGRYRDALQDLQSVLKVQEQQEEEMASHANTKLKLEGGGGTRRSVLIVSPRDDGEAQRFEHMREHHCGVQPDTLVSISALLLQVGNRQESLSYARRAVEMLTKFAAEENLRMSSQASGGGRQAAQDADDVDPATDATPPESARPREGEGVLLRHRQLFVDSVAALHNVAMTQSSEHVGADAEAMGRRRVGKSSHAAALRLGRTVLGCDHAVVVRVESSARQVAQLLAQ